MFLRASSGRQAAFTAPLVARPLSNLRVGTSSWCSRVRVSSKLPLRKRLHLAYASVTRDEGSLKLVRVETNSANVSKSAELKVQRIGIVATASATKDVEKTTTEQAVTGGFLGVKAKAYWSTIGFLPLFFAGLGILALGIKMLKVMKGQWSSQDGVNRAMVNESVITTAEQEADLHVFKCGNCGYEMYPARGREFKFFPDNFKCPLCQSPKSVFWDLNDPDDPRNQEPEDEDDGDLQPAGVQDPNLTGGAPLPGDDGKDGSGSKKD